MNATSLYVSTSRLVLQGKTDDTSTLQDLHKIFPCLRQSLSCSVCGNLLIEPYSPIESNCQHHVCKSCKGGRKKFRASCTWCKDYTRYAENVKLRTLLQCYKKLCHYITTTPIFRILNSSASSNLNNGSSDSNKALIDIIKEGTGLKDNFNFGYYISKNPIGSSSVKSTSTQTLNNGKAVSDKSKGTSSTVNGESTYSVISTNNGNRLTFKRTAKDVYDSGQRNGETEKVIFDRFSFQLH